MTFTITDFLISLPITAIIIFAIKLVYKRAGISATPMGCLIGCLIMFGLYFVLLEAVPKGNELNQNHILLT